MTCAPSEDSDQPGHSPSLIRVFTGCLKKLWVLSYPLSAQRRLIRLGGCPGWSESSLGAHVILLVLSCAGSILCFQSGHDKSKASRSLDTKPTSKVRKTAKSAESKNRKPVRPHTPENQSMASTGGKTSTPTMDGSLFPHEMDIDASAIHPEASLLVGKLMI